MLSVSGLLLQLSREEGGGGGVKAGSKAEAAPWPVFCAPASFWGGRQYVLMPKPRAAVWGVRPAQGQAGTAGKTRPALCRQAAGSGHDGLVLGGEGARADGGLMRASQPRMGG